LTAVSLSIAEGSRPGCVDRIVQLHAAYYSAAHGFGVAFESRVRRELDEFLRGYMPGRDLILLASNGNVIEGSIAIDGSHANEEGAHLRWFITSDAVRGRGAGRQLLERALGFADDCGYGSVHLSTFAGLDAARHLYEANGFRLVHEAPGDQWGAVVREQKFERRRLFGRT
jgi:GNAT superfamily N-acetyltransferase